MEIFRMRVALFCCFVVLMSACGKGGGGGSSTWPAATAPSGGSSSDGTTGSGGAGGDISPPSGTWQDEMLSAVNEQRASGYNNGSTTYRAVGALALDDRLTEAAQRFANDMESVERWAGEDLSSDGTRVHQRVTATGYAYKYVAQTEHKGQATVAEVMAAWMNDPIYRGEIMRAGYTEVGFAHVGSSWVQVLALPLKGVTQRTVPGQEGRVRIGRCGKAVIDPSRQRSVSPALSIHADSCRVKPTRG